MKKQFLMVAAMVLGGTLLVNAQGGGMGGPRRTIAERVATVHAKLDSAFKLEPAKLALADSAFADSYRIQDAKMEEMRSGGSTDRDAMRAEMQKISADRDEKLKKILTEAQFKTWKDAVEPTLRRRPPGGGNN